MWSSGCVTFLHNQELLGVFFKNHIAKFNGDKKRIYQLCEDGLEKICPLGSPFVIWGQSLVMPKGHPWDEFFDPTLTLDTVKPV